MSEIVKINEGTKSDVIAYVDDKYIKMKRNIRNTIQKEVKEFCITNDAMTSIIDQVMTTNITISNKLVHYISDALFPSIHEELSMKVQDTLAPVEEYIDSLHTDTDDLEHDVATIKSEILEVKELQTDIQKRADSARKRIDSANKEINHLYTRIKSINDFGRELTEALHNLESTTFEGIQDEMKAMLNLREETIASLREEVRKENVAKCLFRISDYEEPTPNFHRSDTQLFEKFMKHDLILPDTSRANICMFYNDIRAI